MFASTIPYTCLVFLIAGHSWFIIMIIIISIWLYVNEWDNFLGWAWNHQQQICFEPFTHHHIPSNLAYEFLKNTSLQWMKHKDLISLRSYFFRSPLDELHGCPTDATVRHFEHCPRVARGVAIFQIVQVWNWHAGYAIHWAPLCRTESCRYVFP